MTTSQQSSAKPLTGLRILSIESFAAAPYGTMLLANLGAEVIKIEHAASGGDASRKTAPDGLGDLDSCYYQSFNFGKRSIALDIANPSGKARFLELVGSADAVVNNLRGSKPTELGLDYLSLSRIKPSIVCLHISAYGRGNERADWPGFDYLMQAETGLMSLTGSPDSAPTRAGFSVIDCMSGVVGMVGLLSCLHAAKQTGRGCDVDTSLFEVALHQLSYVATWVLNGQDPVSRQPRSGHPLLTPVQTFPTADGWVFIMCMTPGFWEVMLEAMGLQHLAQDARFATTEARRENRDALTSVLDTHLKTAPTKHWIDRLSGKVPVAPVMDVEQSLASEFVRNCGMLEDIDHPNGSVVKALSMPIRVDGVRPTQAAAPRLGADNDAVLGRAGDMA